MSTPILSLPFGLNVTPNEVHQNLFVNVQRVIDNLKTQCLSLYGRAQIVNMLILAKFQYVSLLYDPPPNFMVILYKKIQKLIWNKDIPEIKRGVILQPIDKGGLNLKHLTLHAIANRGAFYQKLLKYSVSNRLEDQDIECEIATHMMGLLNQNIECRVCNTELATIPYTFPTDTPEDPARTLHVQGKSYLCKSPTKPPQYPSYSP